jgi:hypothetical protein
MARRVSLHLRCHRDQWHISFQRTRVGNGNYGSLPAPVDRCVPPFAWPLARAGGLGTCATDEQSADPCCRIRHGYGRGQNGSNVSRTHWSQSSPDSAGHAYLYGRTRSSDPNRSDSRRRRAFLCLPPDTPHGCDKQPLHLAGRCIGLMP